MIKIGDVIFAGGVSGFFFDDQAALKKNPGRDGFLYSGAPESEGFKSVRMPGECISAGILLEGRGWFFGDCCAVQYSGAGGRDPVFTEEKYLPALEERLKPLLCGRVFDCFREACRFMEKLRRRERNLLHSAVLYGLSQAFLAAFAAEGGVTMAEVVAAEYSLPLAPEPLKIFGQCGEYPYENADKMILKKADVLPHGLVNNLDEKFGKDGGKLIDYIRWLSGRIIRIREDPGYNPEIHIDVYGLPGAVFKEDAGLIAGYLERAARAAEPFLLRVEGPVQACSRERQIELMRLLTEEVGNRQVPVELVADEWCNTLEDIDAFSAAGAGHMLQVKTPDLGGLHSSVEAVMLCKSRGVKAYMGGTCNETDLSARACTHAAMACRPYQLLAKPGMGFDEGYMVVYNEMRRIIAMLKGKDG